MKKLGDSLCRCTACLYQATCICALPMSMMTSEVLTFLHLYALSMWQPGHVVCILQLHPPNCQAICICTNASMKCALTCAGIRHRPCLLLCSYKVHKIHKKKIENPELVDSVQTPGVASSMQKESGQQSNVR